MIRFCLVILCLLSPPIAFASQASVNLDYYPQKNTENLIPFSAPLKSPEARDDVVFGFERSWE